MICAGDGVNGFEEAELSDFLNWYAAQPARLRIFVAGNHELWFDLYPQEALSLIPEGITYLDDSGIKFDDIHFYSVAARPWLHQEVVIPSGIDFLVTHGPAKGGLDEGAGCGLLQDVLLTYKPYNHVFGHIHSCGNQIKVCSKMASYNVSYYEQLQESFKRGSQALCPSSRI